MASGQNEGLGIAVDGGGDAYVTGYTNSTKFPTMNAFQSSNSGGYDAFVTKLNPSGSQLLYSTFSAAVETKRATASPWTAQARPT